MGYKYAIVSIISRSDGNVILADRALVFARWQVDKGSALYYQSTKSPAKTPAILPVDLDVDMDAPSAEGSHRANIGHTVQTTPSGVERPHPGSLGLESRISGYAGSVPGPLPSSHDDLPPRSSGNMGPPPAPLSMHNRHISDSMMSQRQSVGPRASATPNITHRSPPITMAPSPAATVQQALHSSSPSMGNMPPPPPPQQQAQGQSSLPPGLTMQFLQQQQHQQALVQMQRMQQAAAAAQQNSGGQSQGQDMQSMGVGGGGGAQTGTNPQILMAQAQLQRQRELDLQQVMQRNQGGGGGFPNQGTGEQMNAGQPPQFDMSNPQAVALMQQRVLQQQQQQQKINQARMQQMMVMQARQQQLQGQGGGGGGGGGGTPLLNMATLQNLQNLSRAGFPPNMQLPGGLQPAQIQQLMQNQMQQQAAGGQQGGMQGGQRHGG